MTAPNFTNDQVSNQLNSGHLWHSSTITYAYPVGTTGLTAGDGEGAAFRAASAAQQAMFTLAVMTWDDLISSTFTRTTSTASNIEFAYTTTGIEYAHAYFPSQGTVWFNSSEPTLVNVTVGSYGFQTMIHELGHALGLDHMGDYNGEGDFTPSSYQDSVVLSIMSYFGPSAPLRSSDVASADWRGSDNRDHGPQTPMLNDVMVIQQMYGASTTTRTENTVYGFSANLTGSAASLYDFTLNLHPILTIFDSGGTDTIDLSGWSTRSDLHLEAGVYSSANSMTNNLVIAYNCVIENGVCGAGNDTLTGNTADNRLDGGAGNDAINGLDGNDTLVGGAGNDQIDGGSGNDTAVLSGSFASYSFNYNALADLYTLDNALSGHDTFTRVEYFQFSDVLRAASQLLTGDVTAPTLSSTSPADNATGVAAASNLVLSFSETVQAGSGNILIYNSDGTLARSMAVTDTSQVSFSGNRVTLNPSTDLASGASYYLHIGTDVIRDTAGNSFAGISDASTYNFSTLAATPGDTTAPTLVSSSPVDNATAVAPGTSLVLSFSEAVQAGTGSILIYSSSGALVRSIAITDTSQVGFAGSTVTVNPSADLDSASTYYINVSAGALRDLAGNAWAGISGTSTLNFSTASLATADDYPWATNTSGIVTVDGNASTGVIEAAADGDLFRVNLVAGVTYSFALSRSSGGLSDPYLHLYNPSVSPVASDNDSGGSGNAQLTYTATSSGTYYLGVRDAGSGSGAYTLTARTADTLAPTLVSSTPADNAIGVAPGADLVLHFSEAVQAGAGSILIYNSNGTVARTISVTDTSQVTLAGNSVTINPSSDLSAGSAYYVNVGSGALRDAAGNAWAGISNSTALSFTTASTTSTDDYPMSPSTSGVVVVDGAATTGAINFVDDGDLFKVSLTAGVSYLFTLGASAGGLPDPYLVLYNTQSELVTFDDDGGGGLNAQILYTATATGTYYLAAYDAATGTGRYTLSAATSSDDYPWSTSTAGVVTVDAGASTGVINVAGDADLFRLTLSAGTRYTIDLQRTDGGLTDPYLTLYGPDAVELAFDDDSAGNGNARITFTAPSSGTYYVGAFDYATGTGGYTLSARSTATSSNTLTGTGGDDTFTSTAAAEIIDGLAGIDTLQLSGHRAAYSLTQTSSGYTVLDQRGVDGQDTISNVERLRFADQGVALDIDSMGGRAGQVARILGAVFGAGELSNSSYVGIGLSLLDGGMSVHDLCSLAIAQTGRTRAADVVELLWTNVMHTALPADQRALYVGMLDNGMSIGALTALAADSDPNAININLVGLAQTGLAFS